MTLYWTGLFNSTSPNAAKWYDGLVSDNVFVNEFGQFETYVLPSVDLMQPGDVLAGKYTSGSATGHVMVAASIGDPAKINLPGKIPGYNIVTEREVDVHDSTRFPHGNIDSRDEAEDGNDDQGLGWGRIVLYSDPVTDAIIGWKWSTWTSKVYQMTDSEAENYRPMVVGGLMGPGLPGF